MMTTLLIIPILYHAHSIYQCIYNQQDTCVFVFCIWSIVPPVLPVSFVPVVPLPYISVQTVWVVLVAICPLLSMETLTCIVRALAFIIPFEVTIFGSPALTATFAQSFPVLHPPVLKSIV